MFLVRIYDNIESMLQQITISDSVTLFENYGN